MLNVILYTAFEEVNTVNLGSLPNGRERSIPQDNSPAISYGAIAWFPTLKEAKTLRQALNAIQGRFLRTVTGVYRATATEALEIETYCEPLDLYTERQALQGVARQIQQGHAFKIETLRGRL